MCCSKYVIANLNISFRALLSRLIKAFQSVSISAALRSAFLLGITHITYKLVAQCISFYIIYIMRSYDHLKNVQKCPKVYVYLDM
jgi:hypothetical protein